MDPRANSPEKIIPPPPLPYVSRRALRRVTGYLAPPTTCPYCAAEVELVSNADIYGREYGSWPYAYLCSSRACRAYVGLHPDTDLPLGTLARGALRQLRKTHKQAFLVLQHREGWSRRQAYTWLAHRLGIPVEECHWGWFDANRAELAGAICIEQLEASS